MINPTIASLNAFHYSSCVCRSWTVGDSFHAQSIGAQAEVQPHNPSLPNGVTLVKEVNPTKTWTKVPVKPLSRVCSQCCSDEEEPQFLLMWKKIVAMKGTAYEIVFSTEEKLQNYEKRKLWLDTKMKSIAAKRKVCRICNDLLMITSYSKNTTYTIS